MQDSVSPRIGAQRQFSVRSEAAATLNLEDGGAWIGVPFIAEYIAVDRIPLREKAQVGSKVIGWLAKHEVVAVTQVYAGNEMKIVRMKWNSTPKDGWTSHRGKHPNGGSQQVRSQAICRCL